MKTYVINLQSFTVNAESEEDAERQAQIIIESGSFSEYIHVESVEPL